MSFDEIFNYQDAKTYLNDKITKANKQIQTIDDELSILSNLSTVYQSITHDRIKHLNDKKQAFLVSKNRLTEIVSEIIIVESLSAEDKDILYNFYLTFIHSDNAEDVETKKEFMRRIIHNSSNLVSITSELLNDDTITDEEAKYVVELIRETNPIKRDTVSLVHSLPDNL